MSKLTKQQEAFVRFYMGEAKGVAYEAAKLAGYKGNTNALAVNASRLLRNDKIKAAMVKISREEVNKLNIDIASAREETRRKEAVHILDREGRRQLLTEFAEDEECSPKDRMKAIELLGKMGGDFIERRQVDVTQHKTKEEQVKSQDFIQTVKPEELKNLLDKTYEEEPTIN